MKRKILFIACLVALLGISSCRISKRPAYFDFETECLNSKGDGSLILRVWGEGQNASEATEQAKKNAIQDVLFKGITKGLQGYQSRPLVPEVNARQKYMDYFDDFFKDGSTYSEFVSLKNGKFRKPKYYRKADSQVRVTTVRVDVPRLRKRLQQDGILK